MHYDHHDEIYFEARRLRAQYAAAGIIRAVKSLMKLCRLNGTRVARPATAR